MTTLKHALIIDDDAYNLEVLMMLLATKGLTSSLVQDVDLANEA